MATLGFKPSDFEVFKVEGFDERMEQIYAHVRPKLIRLGNELAIALARKLRMEFFPHVARHGRRTINPPPETWAAFGPSARGYKRYSYLALCISGVGLHARAVVKPEADKRSEMAKSLRVRTPQLIKDFKGTRIARYDKWDFKTPPVLAPAGADLFTALAEGLARKTGSLDLGFGWNVRESIRLDREELLDAYRELAPIYRLTRAAA